MAKYRIKQFTPAIPGLVLLVLMAIGLTYGSQRVVAEVTKPKPAVVKTVTETKTEDTTTTDAATPATTSGGTSTAAASTASTPAASATPAPATKTATTNSFVYLRPTASTTGTALQSLQAGTPVQYEVQATGLWQKVTVNGQEGYVYKKWLTY